jgi:hypothetical protein
MSAVEEPRATQGENAKAAKGAEPWSWGYWFVVWIVRFAAFFTVFFIFLLVVAWLFGDLDAVLADLNKDHKHDLKWLQDCLDLQEERRTVKFHQHDCKSIVTILWYHIPVLPVLGWDVRFFTHVRRVLWNTSRNTLNCIISNILLIGAAFMGILGLNAAFNMLNNMLGILGLNGWLPSLPSFFSQK